MMAAESGYAAAQFNVAYLCEQHTVSYWYISWSLGVLELEALSFIHLQHFYRYISLMCMSSKVFWILTLHQTACGGITTLRSKTKILTVMVNKYPLTPHMSCLTRKTFTTETYALLLSILYYSLAFIRMGDLLYEGQGRRKKDLFSAAEMYTKAALSDEPQVCFL